MFVQITRSTHAGRIYLTYLVRESFRTADGPRSRTVCSLTPLPPETRDLIAQSLRGQSFVPTDALELPEAAQVPKDMNAMLDKLGLLPLFAAPPVWATASWSK